MALQRSRKRAAHLSWHEPHYFETGVIGALSSLVHKLRSHGLASEPAGHWTESVGMISEAEPSAVNAGTGRQRGRRSKRFPPPLAREEHQWRPAGRMHAEHVGPEGLPTVSGRRRHGPWPGTTNRKRSAPVITVAAGPAGWMSDLHPPPASQEPRREAARVPIGDQQAWSAHGSSSCGDIVDPAVPVV